MAPAQASPKASVCFHTYHRNRRGTTKTRSWNRNRNTRNARAAAMMERYSFAGRTAPLTTAKADATAYNAALKSDPRRESPRPCGNMPDLAH
jgi:hypothetical protein